MRSLAAFRRTHDPSEEVSIIYVNTISPLTTGTAGAKKIFKYRIVGM